MLGWWFKYRDGERFGRAATVEEMVAGGVISTSVELGFCKLKIGTFWGLRVLY